MKQTFTLLTAFACSILSAFSQTTSEDFETNSLATLGANCWTFSAMGTSSTNGVGNSISIYNNEDQSAVTTTPYINLSAGTTISFDYKLAGRINGQAKRNINVSLVDVNGAVTSLGSILIDRNTNAGVYDDFTFTYTSTTASVQKLRIEITSGAEGRTDIHLDNISIGTATFNNTGVYDCNNASPITLPIKLRSFQGLVAADKVQLSWSVSDNETGSHFEVERSLDGKEFKTIAIVNTTGAAGDASYTYNDAAQTAAYYRLKIVNNTKSITYSNILFIKNTGVATNSNALNLLQNPVLSTLKFSFVSDAAASTEVAVYNMSGVKVYQTSFKALKGNNQIATILDGSIKSGTYVLEVKNANNRSVAKFVKN